MKTIVRRVVRYDPFSNRERLFEPSGAQVPRHDVGSVHEGIDIKEALHQLERLVEAAQRCAIRPVARCRPRATPALSEDAISRALCVRRLNCITDAREITCNVRSPDRCTMTSSVMPSAKYSVSGSALRFRKGSSATTGDALRTGSGAARRRANSAAVGRRSLGVRASASMIALSAAGGTAARKPGPKAPDPPCAWSAPTPVSVPQGSERAADTSDWADSRTGETEHALDKRRTDVQIVVSHTVPN